MALERSARSRRPTGGDAVTIQIEVLRSAASERYIMLFGGSPDTRSELRRPRAWSLI